MHMQLENSLIAVLLPVFSIIFDKSNYKIQKDCSITFNKCIIRHKANHKKQLN